MIGVNQFVYHGPTRGRDLSGFDEDMMYHEFRKSDHAVKLEEHVSRLGFRYAGHTNSASKANTGFESKRIRINKDLSCEVAALSFAYELGNASQYHEFKQITSMPRDISEPTMDDACLYAERALRREAKSVLIRSQVAISMGREYLVVNPKYNEMAQAQYSDAEKENLIYLEMKENGKVHGGSKEAFKHYTEVFFEAWKKAHPTGSEQWYHPL